MHSFKEYYLLHEKFDLDTLENIYIDKIAKYFPNFTRTAARSTAEAILLFLCSADPTVAMTLDDPTDEEEPLWARYDLQERWVNDFSEEQPPNAGKYCQWIIKRALQKAAEEGYQKVKYLNQSYTDATGKTIDDTDPGKTKQYMLFHTGEALKRIAKEDVEGILKNFLLFNNPRIRQVLPVKDINQYKTFAELGQALAPIKDQLKEEKYKSKKERQYNFTILDGEFDRENEKFIMGKTGAFIAVPNDKWSAGFLGKGTEWCTAIEEANYYNAYTNGGPSGPGGSLYCIIPHEDNKKADGKIQLHFPTGQYMDYLDHDIDKQWWINYIKPIENHINQNGNLFEKVALFEDVYKTKYNPSPEEIQRALNNDSSSKFLRSVTEKWLHGIIGNIKTTNGRFMNRLKGFSPESDLTEGYLLQQINPGLARAIKKYLPAPDFIHITPEIVKKAVKSYVDSAMIGIIRDVVEQHSDVSTNTVFLAYNIGAEAVDQIEPGLSKVYSSQYAQLEKLITEWGERYRAWDKSFKEWDKNYKKQEAKRKNQ